MRFIAIIGGIAVFCWWIGYNNLRELYGYTNLVANFSTVSPLITSGLMIVSVIASVVVLVFLITKSFVDYCRSME